MDNIISYRCMELNTCANTNPIINLIILVNLQILFALSIKVSAYHMTDPGCNFISKPASTPNLICLIQKVLCSEII